MTADLRVAPRRIAQPTDRFKLTDIPMVNPAKCACCGAVNRPVVDFDMTIPMYGAVLLCTSCLATGAELIDMVPAVELRAAERHADQSLSCQLSKLGMKAITDEQFESVLVAIGGLSDVLLSIVPSDADLVADTTTEGQLRLFNFDVKVADGESGVIEFPDSLDEQEHDVVVSKGPDSVSADSSDGDDFFKL